MQYNMKTRLQKTGFAAIIARPSQVHQKLDAHVFYGQEA